MRSAHRYYCFEGLTDILIPRFGAAVISRISVANLRFSSSGRGVPVSQPFGGHSEGETPLPIPNREVKPLRADGTWPSRAGESRSPPIYLTARPRGRPVCLLRLP